nr:rhodanese-like domain-containing protein [Nodosilinea sp. LEGE 07088]
MSSTAESQLQEIDVSMLKHWLDRGEAVLIDVREPTEYASEHIPGARLMPLSAFDPSKLMPLTDKRIVLQCQSGNRSTQAAQKMLAAGFDQVAHLQGGLPTWKAAGYKTEVNKNAPISMFRQVQIVAGSLVLIGTVLGAWISPWFLLLSGLVGTGLAFAGITNTCAMAMLLAKLPYNRRAVHTGNMIF